MPSVFSSYFYIYPLLKMFDFSFFSLSPAFCVWCKKASYKHCLFSVFLFCRLSSISYSKKSELQKSSWDGKSHHLWACHLPGLLQRIHQWHCRSKTRRLEWLYLLSESSWPSLEWPMSTSTLQAGYWCLRRLVSRWLIRSLLCRWSLNTCTTPSLLSVNMSNIKGRAGWWEKQPVWVGATTTTSYLLTKSREVPGCHVQAVIEVVFVTISRTRTPSKVQCNQLQWQAFISASPSPWQEL